MKRIKMEYLDELLDAVDDLVKAWDEDDGQMSAEFHDKLVDIVKDMRRLRGDIG